eukprot:GGOE01004491.1.p1 GENE.GGOE01004491.1~~GGOE01004491.1.p1  ORF type:complete len:288 (+),score=51.42 GGOE01004491.1:765-1628(+)
MIVAAVDSTGDEVVDLFSPPPLGAACPNAAGCAVAEPSTAGLMSMEVMQALQQADASLHGDSANLQPVTCQAVPPPPDHPASCPFLPNVTCSEAFVPAASALPDSQAVTVVAAWTVANEFFLSGNVANCMHTLSGLLRSDAVRGRPLDNLTTRIILARLALQYTHRCDVAEEALQGAGPLLAEIPPGEEGVGAVRSQVEALLQKVMDVRKSSALPPAECVASDPEVCQLLRQASSSSSSQRNSRAPPSDRRSPHSMPLPQPSTRQVNGHGRQATNPGGGNMDNPIVL